MAATAPISSHCLPRRRKAAYAIAAPPATGVLEALAPKRAFGASQGEGARRPALRRTWKADGKRASRRPRYPREFRVPISNLSCRGVGDRTSPAIARRLALGAHRAGGPDMTNCSFRGWRDSGAGFARREANRSPIGRSRRLGRAHHLCPREGGDTIWAPAFAGAYEKAGRTVGVAPASQRRGANHLTCRRGSPRSRWSPRRYRPCRRRGVPARALRRSG